MDLDAVLETARRGWTFDDGCVGVIRAANDLADAVERVRALHQPWPNGDQSCRECVELDGTPSPWPCATIRALAGDPVT